MDKEMFVPASDADVGRLAMIQAIRQVDRSVDTLRLDMREERKVTVKIGQTLVRVEAALEKVSANSEAIADLNERVNDLEADRDRRAGATSLADYTLKSPILTWLIALGAVVIAWLKK